MPAPADLQGFSVQTFAQCHGFSVDAVRQLQAALTTGAGRIASFDHPELGGPGLWLRGGLLMLSDPFNHELRARVDALCYALGDCIPPEPPMTNSAPGDGIRPASAAAPVKAPADRATPNASGQHDDLHYAHCTEPRRLALKTQDRLRRYDTGEHRDPGMSQQSNDGYSRPGLTRQHGALTTEDLTDLSAPEASPSASSPVPSASQAASPADRILAAAIERLEHLYGSGHLTDEEFKTAKQSLLARL